MVKKLLVFLVVTLLFVFSVSQSQAAKSFGATCAKADISTGIYTNFDFPATYPFTTNPANQTVYKSNDCGNNYVCRPFPGQGTICQDLLPPGSLADGAYCDANAECQSGYCIWAPNVTNVHSCGQPPTTPTPKIGGTANGNPCRTPSECQSGYCVSAVANHPEYSLCQPNPGTSGDSGGTASGATPTPTSCSSNGIKTKTYDKSLCSLRAITPEAKSISFTCNDGTQKTLTSASGCIDTRRLDSNAANFCSSHSACPTPISLACDPVKDGIINNAEYELWLKEYSHQANTTLTSCFTPGNTSVDILDFQVWKDINYGLKQSF